MLRMGFFSEEERKLDFHLFPATPCLSASDPSHVTAPGAKLTCSCVDSQHQASGHSKEKRSEQTFTPTPTPFSAGLYIANCVLHLFKFRFITCEMTC